jgi:hypothetical protein
MRSFVAIAVSLEAILTNNPRLGKCSVSWSVHQYEVTAAVDTNFTTLLNVVDFMLAQLGDVMKEDRLDLIFNIFEICLGASYNDVLDDKRKEKYGDCNVMTPYDS